LQRDRLGNFDLAWNSITGDAGNHATNRLIAEGIEVLTTAIDTEFGAVTQVGVIEERQEAFR
jgi:hypothetical protein